MVRPGFLKWSGLVCVLLLPFVVHAIWDYVEARRMNRRIDAIASSGEPVRSSPFQANVRSAPAADADRYYRAAAALVTGVTQDQHWSAAQFTEALSFVDRAAALTFEGFATGTSYSYLTAQLTILSRLCEERAVGLSTGGDADGAFESLTSAARLARTHEWAVVPRIDAVRTVVRAAVPSPSVREHAARAFKDLVQPDAARHRFLLQRGFMLEQLAAEHHRVPHVESWIVRPWRIHEAVRQLDGYAAFIAGQPPVSNDFETASLREESRFMERRLAILECEYRLVAGESPDCGP
ncbi:MAG TPA: hypothetical protein VH583_19655 [Vicinamibacterales bacterium]|jgi:hypothetical protein